MKNKALKISLIILISLLIGFIVNYIKYHDKF